MQPVANVAESREREAAIMLGKAQLELQSQVARLQELSNYHAEYQQRFERSGTLGINAVQIQSFLSFLANLQKAVDQQKVVISQAEARVEQKKQVWFTLRGKLRAIDTIVDNYRCLEQKEQDKLEQKIIDELAQRMSKSRDRS